MIRFLKQPYPCSFTKNAIEFKVTSDMQFPTPKVYPYLEIEVVIKPNVGIHINFEFTNPDTGELEYVNVVAAWNPELNNHIPTGSFPGTLAQYATEMARCLRQIYPLNAFFDITSGNKLVKIKAKQPIEDLVIKNIECNQGATNHFLFYNHVELADPLERDGFTLKALVYYENNYLSDDFRLVADLQCFSDNDAIAQIDISDVIDSEIEAGMENFPIPGIALAKSNLLRRYYVEFIEIWNENPKSIKTKSQIMYAHWGGVSTNDERLGDAITLLQNQRHFLTWWPSGKQLYPLQNDWISWMNTSNKDQFYFVLKIYKNTGVSQYNGAPILLQRWESATMAIGYTQRDIQGFLSSGETLKKWSVFVKNSSDEIVSNEMIYYVGSQSCYQSEALVFNSFGAPETISFVDWEETNVISTDVVNKSQLFNSNRLKPDAFVFNSSHQNFIIAETSRLQQTEAYRLQSTLNSLMCFIRQGNRWIPAVMNNDKRKVLIESELTASLSVEIMIANSNDRASFYDAVPSLTVDTQNGIGNVSIEANGIDIEDHGLLEIFDGDGYSFDCTYEWDPALQVYVPNSISTTPGIYYFKVTVYAFDGTAHQATTTIQYYQQEVSFQYDNINTIGFKLRSINASEYINIDFGVGTGFNTYNYTSSITDIFEITLKPGTKTCTLRKPNFSDIVEFESSILPLKNMKWQLFTGLNFLTVNNAIWNETVYLNGCTNMRDIHFSSCQILGLEIGLMPMLKSLVLDECTLFTSNAVDALIAEIWSMRKHFLPTGGFLDVQIIGSGLSFSAFALKMINGTDEYAGEGLNTNYNFTFYID